jgi:integrase
MAAAEHITTDEANRMLASTLSSNNPQRDACIFMMGLKAGLRPGEIALLTWDIVLDSAHKHGKIIKQKKFTLPTRIVKGKKKTRPIIFNAFLWSALHQHFLANFTHKNDRIFLTDKKQPFTPTNMRKFISRKFKQVQIQGSGHSFRKRAGTDVCKEVHKRGGTIFDVMRWFGHSNVMVTSRYLEIDKQVMIQAAMSI